MRISILCIGNKLRGDDYLGILFGKYIKKIYPNFNVFLGYDTPEDCFFDIKNTGGDLLIIVDAAVDLEYKSGAEFVDNLADIKPVSTHAVPLNVMSKYLEESYNKIIYLAMFVEEKNIQGIQRKITKSGKKSLEVAINKFKNFIALINN